MTRNYVYETGSMTGILGQLKWESLKKRRKENRLILLNKCKARIPKLVTLFPRLGAAEISTIWNFRYPALLVQAHIKIATSFLGLSIRDWNNLGGSPISYTELSDDCVSKFTSLVRVRN